MIFKRNVVYVDNISDIYMFFGKEIVEEFPVDKEYCNVSFHSDNFEEDCCDLWEESRLLKDNPQEIKLLSILYGAENE